MRERKYDNGTTGMIDLPYDNIPDDYQMMSCLTNDCDLSYAGVMKSLKEMYKDKIFDKGSHELGIEFQDNAWYSQEITLHQSYDFLESARFLGNGIHVDRGQDIVSYYTIPCAYCCRHAVELYLKYCALVKGIDHRKLINHNITDLWNILDEKNTPYYDKLSNYIKELDTIDANGMALRYGLSKSFDAPNETFQFNIDIMICNAMYLINILTEHVVQSYLYKSNEGKSDSDCL